MEIKLKEELLNLILTFKVRSVIQNAQPEKETSEVDTGILTGESVRRIFEVFSSAIKEAKRDERKICRQIFIDEVDWSEWGVDDNEAGKIFDEAREALNQQGGE